MTPGRLYCNNKGAEWKTLFEQRELFCVVYYLLVLCSLLLQIGLVLHAFMTVSV